MAVDKNPPAWLGKTKQKAAKDTGQGGFTGPAKEKAKAPAWLQSVQAPLGNPFVLVGSTQAGTPLRDPFAPASSEEEVIPAPKKKGTTELTKGKSGTKGGKPFSTLPVGNVADVGLVPHSQQAVNMQTQGAPGWLNALSQIFGSQFGYAPDMFDSRPLVAGQQQPATRRALMPYQPTTLSPFSTSPWASRDTPFSTTYQKGSGTIVPFRVSNQASQNPPYSTMPNRGTIQQRTTGNSGNTPGGGGRNTGGGRGYYVTGDDGRTYYIEEAGGGGGGWDNTPTWMMRLNQWNIR